MNDLIRSSDCVSCTITNVDNHGNAIVSYANFKEARFDTSFIVLYEHNNKYYYPIFLEYRLIDNNLLYLIQELSVSSMEEVFKVLSSSMEKEEKWTNKFLLALVHLKKPPMYCFELQNFELGNIDMVEIYE